MSNVTSARHRKAARPVTPLTGTGANARRGIAVAASSGLALTMIASGASAAGNATEVGDSAGSLKNSSLAALTESVRAADATNSAVTVSNNVKWKAAAKVESPTSVVAPQEPTVTEAPAATRTETTDAVETTTATTAAAVQTTETTTTEAATTTPSVSSSSTGSAILAIAMQYQGAPYVFGATGPSAFDCSGFVQYVYAQVGISLPRTSYAQGASGYAVSAAQAQPGDIVYYGGHVGIYAGNGMMIDAGNYSTGVIYRAVYGSPSYIHVG